VTLRETEQAIADLVAEALEVTVDAANLAAGDHPATVTVVASQGLTVEQVEPQTIRLRVTRQ
jgi:YbbR domain-containing protein